MVSIEVPLENLKTKRMRTEVFSHDLGNLHRYDNIYIYTYYINAYHLFTHIHHTRPDIFSRRHSDVR